MKARDLLLVALAVTGSISLLLPVAVLAEDKDDLVGASVERPPAALSTTPTTQPAAPIDPVAARLLAEERSLKEVRWERTKVAIDDAQTKARNRLLKPEARLTADDFTEARRMVGEAVRVLESNLDVAPGDEYKSISARLADLKAYVDRMEEEWNARQVQEQHRIAEEDLRKRVDEEYNRRLRRVEELMNQVLSARQEGDQESVIRLLDQIIQIDPENRQAKWMREDADIANTIQRQKKTDDRKDWAFRDAMVNIREAQTPYDRPMNYPDPDIWKELTERRGPYAIGLPPESPANQRVHELMKKTVPEIRFQAITFENALNFLRDLQRVNLNPNWGAMEALGITKATEVTLQLRDVTFETALRELLAKVAGREDVLDYMIRDGVIKVSTKEDLATLKYILVYDVRDLLHPLTDFRAPAIRRDVSRGDTGDTTGDTGDNGLFGDTGDDTTQQQTSSEEDRLKKVEAFSTLIRTTVLPDSWAPTGDANLTETDGLLVIKQTANGHRELAKLLQQLREHSRMQVTIEARFLEIESAFLEDIGFDLDFIFHRNPGNTGWSAIPFNIGSFADTAPNRQGAWVDAQNQPTRLQAVGPDFFQVGRSSLVVAGSFLDDLQVDFFLRATQAHRQSTHLNALRVTLLNGHEAYILVESQTDYVSELIPSVATGATAFRPVVDQMIKGISFGVRATVTADRRYVLMTVYPTLRDDREAPSSPFKFQTGGTTTTTTPTTTTPIPVVPGPPPPASAGRGPYPQIIPTPTVITPISPVVGAQEAQIQLREAVIQEVRTTVMVPDRGTLLLGGQRLADELEFETGVPILSKIPIIKRAFTHRNFVKRERTLLILIRPEILIPEEMEPK